MKPLLHIKDLNIRFHGDNTVTNAVKDLNLQLNRGEILAIVGESGSGKSVTSLAILQLLPRPPAEYVNGSINFNLTGDKEIDLLQLPEKEIRTIRGSQIGMIFQEPMTSLNPVLTCGSQVMEAILNHKSVTKTAAREQTISWFNRVKLPDPEGLFHKYPHQLSGGQKQRVMIAMAMCNEPALLICDEPTTALDVTVQRSILELIRDLQQSLGISVIFITHDLGVVSEIADRVAILYRGELIETGTTKNIFSAAKHPYTKALIACRPALHPKGAPLPVVADFIEGKQTTNPEPVQLPKISGQKILEVEHLFVRYVTRTNLIGQPKKWFTAVNDVSFIMNKGETLGLVGESGCGKTTLGRSILKLIDADAGIIKLNGEDITKMGAAKLRDLRQAMQLIFQDPYSSLNPRLTIGEAITEPLLVTGRLKRKHVQKKARELLQMVCLDPAMFSRYPHEFSGGQRQRIVIARALSVEPTFLVCDESVSALDVSVQAQILNLLNELKVQLDLSMLFISHDLSVVKYFCDYIMVMHAGTIIERGPADEVYQAPKEDYTKKLIAAVPIHGLNQ